MNRYYSSLVAAMSGGGAGAAGELPATLENIAFWFDPSDASTVTATGTDLTALADKAGLVDPLTVASGQVAVGAVTQNDLNLLTPVSTGNPTATTVNDFSFLHQSSPYLFGCVFRSATSTSQSMLFGTSFTSTSNRGFGIGTWNGGLRATATNGSAYILGTTTGAAPVSSSTLYVMTAIVDLSQASGENRLLVALNGGSILQPNPSFVIGAPAAGEASVAFNYPFNTGERMGELVCARGADATEANRTALRDYLNAKWAVY